VIQVRLSILLVAILAILPAGLADASTRASVVNVQVSHDSFKAHSEPALAQNPRNPLNLIAGSKFFTNPAKYRFKIGTYYSLDGGRTWHDDGLLPGFGNYSIVSDVSLAFSASGTAYVSVLAEAGKTSGIFVSRSTDGGKTWSQPVTVFLDTTGRTFSDKPWIAVDRTNRATAGNVYVAWNLDGPSQKDADAGNEGAAMPEAIAHPEQTVPQPTGLVIARSTDGGRTFSPPQVLEPFTADEFPLGAIPAVGPKGQVYVVWCIIGSNGRANGQNFVMSGNGGKSFTVPRTITSVDGLPDHLPNSTFRNLSMPSFAVSPRDGSMIVTWSDMRRGNADIYETSSTDGGRTWSAPIRVNHDSPLDGKDQFQPEVAVAPNGTYYISWFDRRWDPNNRLVDVAIARSTDDGTIFGPNIRVTNTSWNPAIDAPVPNKGDTFIGDYQALIADNSGAYPLWNDTQDGKSQQIRMANVTTRVFVAALKARRHS